MMHFLYEFCQSFCKDSYEIGVLVERAKNLPNVQGQRARTDKRSMGPGLGLRMQPMDSV